MTTDKPYVSIVIPTYNREEMTCQTVEHLFPQNYPDYEIIVVDQSSHVSPEALCFYQKNNEKIKYYRLSKPFLPYARNLGIKLAKGEIVLFLDNDIIPQHDKLISNHVRNYSDPTIGGVAGGVLLEGQSLRFDRKKVGALRKIDFKYTHNYDSGTRMYVDTATGCNMSFRKEALVAVNGFSNLFFPNIYLDDSDISIRIRNLGYRIIFDPDAALLHLHGEGGNRDETDNSYNKSFRMFHNEALFYFKNLNTLFFSVFFLQEIRRIIIRSRRTDIYRVYPGLKGLMIGSLKGIKLLFDLKKRGGSLDLVKKDHQPHP